MGFVRQHLIPTHVPTPEKLRNEAEPHEEPGMLMGTVAGPRFAGCKTKVADT